MAGRGGIVWVRPPKHLIANVEAYGERVQAATLAVAQLIADEAEAQAKASAPWTDRTGQARQGLTGLSRRAAKDLVAIYLYHKADHGKWLEIARGGPYKVIMPTLEQLYPRVMAQLRQALGGR